jgi:hypothetical protein
MWIIILMFAFTEYVPDVKLRHDCGWVFIYFIYANIACNMLLIIYTMYNKVYKVVFLKYSWYLFKKRRSRILAHNGLVKRVGKYARDARVD